jgi:hypothetical protein
MNLAGMNAVDFDDTLRVGQGGRGGQGGQIDFVAVSIAFAVNLLAKRISPLFPSHGVADGQRAGLKLVFKER